MGLDTSHDCWSGAYPSFLRWRNTLAEAAGFGMEKTDFGAPIYALDWEQFSSDNLNGDWEKSIHIRDPLLYLLAHADCEGHIKPEQATPLADRLEELLPHLDDSDRAFRTGSCKVTTEKFIAGLREAVKENENVEFY